MRIVAWNCNMALHRKIDALMALKPDVAIVSECANPERLLARGMSEIVTNRQVWIGENRDKGLAVFAFNGFSARLLDPYYPTLRYIAPVRISGASSFNLLAVWAQNASAGLTRKNQLGPVRRAMTKYRHLFAGDPTIIAGDLNNNVFWDKPGWRMNHATAVANLRKLGLASAYHSFKNEAQGQETEPTIYWRDRKKDGPTYHLDYIFMPDAWIERAQHVEIGSFEDWCGSGLSDHVPIIADIDL